MFWSTIRAAGNSSSSRSSNAVSLYACLGFGLLYASAYFLRPLGLTGAYLLPSTDLWRLIIAPSLLGVVVAGGFIYAVGTAARYWCGPTVARAGLIVMLSFLTMIGLKGLMDAAGYDWQDKIIRSGDLLASQRHFKTILFIAILLAIVVLQRLIPKLTRLLSSLGYAFGALAVLRLLSIWHGSQVVSPLSSDSVASAIRTVQANSVLATPASKIGGKLRRVVWVIFDETDFSRVYGSEVLLSGKLQNFDRLARSSVFATNANSPASATLYSIPALLTGVPIAGQGVNIDATSSLSLQSEDSQFIPFGQATSIFGALAAPDRGASALGFYQPYCKLFRLKRCVSFAWPDLGGMDAAILANIPGVISQRFGHVDAWSSIAQQSLQVLPEFLARDDALTFLHLNVPHLPASYADKILQLPASPNPLIEYAHNLILADQILGEIMDGLRMQTTRRDVLLVVSTDHWLRQFWFDRNAIETSRPVPFMVWKVGDSQGYALDQPVSTVHTAAMILDYLNGNISTQADIASWWRNQSVHPSFVAPNT